jgi:adenylylsulfate kinase
MAIIWFTGQPNSGKTTLSLQISYELDSIKKCTINNIDGDVLRTITNNIDYSKEGRRKNIKTAIDLSIESDKLYDYTIVSLVSPFRDLRESLKADSNHTVFEIYLHSIRFREGRMVDYYEPPLSNFLDIDTDKYTIQESIKLIKNYII